MEKINNQDKKKGYRSKSLIKKGKTIPILAQIILDFQRPTPLIVCRAALASKTEDNLLSLK
jgi:hypothetical protein